MLQVIQSIGQRRSYIINLSDDMMLKQSLIMQSDDDVSDAVVSLMLLNSIDNFDICDELDEMTYDTAYV